MAVNKCFAVRSLYESTKDTFAPPPPSLHEGQWVARTALLRSAALAFCHTTTWGDEENKRTRHEDQVAYPPVRALHWGNSPSEVNPNTRVMNSRGIWLTYALGVGMLHVVLLSIPFFSVPVVWTLTNVIHNF
ncbi:hypothetical protein CRUP_032741, partial [Coryphaenoides rupestris]